MRYIGGKSLMLDRIMNVINDNTENVNTVIDAFAGSNTVSTEFKKNNFKVKTNDLLYFSYVISRGTLGLNKKPLFKKLGIKDPIKYLNELTIDKTNIKLEDCFVFNNYSPNDNCSRMFFQNDNALLIDLIRITIENWKNTCLINEDEYYYLLASLLNAVPYVSNIAGIYGAYLKFWDARTYNKLTLEEPVILNGKKSVAYNCDANQLIRNEKADLVYLDTPYNGRQYLPNYHVLETIAKYDYPIIKGVTGIRQYSSSDKSLYCNHDTALKAFSDFFQNTKCRYVLVSYNNESVISTEEMSDLCKQYAVEGSFKLYEYDYRRYKSKIKNDEVGLKEQLYFFEKKMKYDKSPMNYIGGKYKILPQLMPLFPTCIDTFVDVFGGGLDVSINVNAKRIIANDINDIVVNMYNKMKTTSLSELIFSFDKIIEDYNLSKTNEEGYLQLRKDYNIDKNPLKLYMLICYSFNYQIRFNSKFEYNNPFGKNKSSFNESVRQNFIKFHRKLQKIELKSCDFRKIDYRNYGKNDFLYFDPPYLITCGSYNDGKRGFTGWTKNEEYALLNILDELNEKGIKFALSNVIEHKGVKNDILSKWSLKYNVHYIYKNYNNSNYQSSNKEHRTVEVLITNY